MEGEKIPNSNDPQELREIVDAALVLTWMKHVNLDPETKSELNRQISATRSGKAPRTEREDHHGKFKRKNHEFDCFVDVDQNPPRARVQLSQECQNWDANQAIREHPMVQKTPNLIGRCSKALEKTPSLSDVDHNLQRFLFHKDNANRAFDPLLLEKERKNLHGGGIEVTVYGEDCEEYVMHLRSWADKKCLVLTKGWKNFFIEQKLKAEDKVSLCMFRHARTKKLCFLFSSTSPGSGSGIVAGGTRKQRIKKLDKGIS